MGARREGQPRASPRLRSLSRYPGPSAGRREAVLSSERAPNPGKLALFLLRLAPRRFPVPITGPRRTAAFRASFRTDATPKVLATGFAGAATSGYPLFGCPGAHRCAGRAEIPAVTQPFAEPLTVPFAVPFAVPLVRTAPLARRGDPGRATRGGAGGHRSLPSARQGSAGLLTVIDPFAAGF